MTKTLDDVHEILSEIFIFLKESDNNRTELIELNDSPYNNLPSKINLDDYVNVVIKSIDQKIIKTDNILSGTGKVKLSWKE